MRAVEGLKELKLLYVEDETDTREELSRFLKRRIGSLVTAANGMEGLEKFKLHQPDLVITDLRMPEMSGMEMLEQIRLIDPICPVIIISALSDSATLLDAVQKGIAHYVVKPVDPSELQLVLEKVNEQIRHRRSQLIQPIISAWLPLDDRDEKVELESKLKSAYAHFIKTLTGKGPREVHVHLSQGKVTFIAQGVLTSYETNLMINRRNQSLVAYSRNVLYTEHSQTLEGEIGKLVHLKATLSEIEILVEKNTDRITLNFSNSSQ